VPRTRAPAGSRPPGGRPANRLPVGRAEPVSHRHAHRPIVTTAGQRDTGIDRTHCLPPGQGGRLRCRQRGDHAGTTRPLPRRGSRGGSNSTRRRRAPPPNWRTAVRVRTGRLPERQRLAGDPAVPGVVRLPHRRRRDPMLRRRALRCRVRRPGRRHPGERTHRLAAGKQDRTVQRYGNSRPGILFRRHVRRLAPTVHCVLFYQQSLGRAVPTGVGATRMPSSPPARRAGVIVLVGPNFPARPRSTSRRDGTKPAGRHCWAGTSRLPARRARIIGYGAWRQVWRYKFRQWRRIAELARRLASVLPSTMD
jgi:hypothetical protein